MSIRPASGMIITCPHCQTRYQVTYQAIGAAGRKVQCANCHEAWQELPHDPVEDQTEDDVLFDAESENRLDAELIAEARSVAAEVEAHLAREQAITAPPPPPSVPREAAVDLARRQRAFRRRRKLLGRHQPFERLRRAMRLVIFLVLAGVLAGGYFGRVSLVTQFPALAGIYEAVGLGVNVLGLDFANVETLRVLREGRDYLTVTADIVGLARDPALVPPVIVTLTDAAGAPIYQWSVTPDARTLVAGERARVETQLASPPAGAEGVRLSFSGGRGGEAAPASAQTETEIEGDPS